MRMNEVEFNRLQIECKIIANDEGCKDDLEELRKNYYKAVEGVAALKQTLKYLAQNYPIFTQEYIIATKANEELDESHLGRIL